MIAYDPGAITWRTSSYSGGSGSCVEVGWRKSSHSGDSGGCVEVAPAPPGVAVRDSKHPTGPTLTIPHTPWRAFLTNL